MEAALLSRKQTGLLNAHFLLEFKNMKIHNTWSSRYGFSPHLSPGATGCLGHPTGGKWLPCKERGGAVMLYSSRLGNYPLVASCHLPDLVQPPWTLGRVWCYTPDKMELVKKKTCKAAVQVVGSLGGCIVCHPHTSYRQPAQGGRCTLSWMGHRCLTKWHSGWAVLLITGIGAIAPQQLG